MKVLLIMPNIPLKARMNDDVVYESLGLLYLGTVLKADYEVNVIDAFSENLSLAQVIGHIEEIEPDVVGFSLMFDAMYDQFRELIDYLREKKSGVTFFAGGAYGTLNYYNILKYNPIDYILMNEGEVAVCKFMKLLESNRAIAEEDLYKIKNLAFKNDAGDIHTNENEPLIADLNTIPIPDRTLMGDAYSNNNIVPMISSRGCGHGCIYCSTDKMWKSLWRPRSAQNIIDEILYLVTTGRLTENKMLSFIDDNFTRSKKRVLEFCELLKVNNLRIRWSCSSRPETLDESLIQTIAAAGCESIFLGVESGSSKVLKLMKRGYDKNYIINLSKTLIENGIIPKASFMIGIPYEDVEDIAETFELIKKMYTYNVSIHVFTPRVGTETYENPEKFNMKLYESDSVKFNDDTKSIISTEHLSNDQINNLYVKALGLIYKKNKMRDYYLSHIKKYRIIREEKNAIFKEC